LNILPRINPENFWDGVLTVLCSEIRHCAKRQNVSRQFIGERKKKLKRVNMKLIITFLIVILFASCKQNEQNILQNFAYEDIARYTIASVMGQPTEIITATNNKNLYFVSYIRKSDKQRFDYKIKFEGNKIIWASIDGRWRNSEYDEKISFEENGEKLKIITTFSDMSQDIQEYKKGE
jgi:hypothetical protein